MPDVTTGRRSATLLAARLLALAIGFGAMPVMAVGQQVDPAPVNLMVGEPLPSPDPDPAGSSSFPQNPGSTSGAVARRWAVFGQSTFTAMTSLGFRAPYAGDHSLPTHDLRETFDATVFAGARLWQGGEIWTTGEIDQGFGVGNTLGVAGYPSGEAYKLGKAQPYTRLQRLYLRQTFALGGATSPVEASANQMPGQQSADRLVITVGKFNVTDVFDTNKYAHDPRGDFLNWSLIDAGAFDYAGDPWGFTYGASAELTLAAWTLRAGLFNLTDMPGGMKPVTDFSFFQAIGEIEHRQTLFGHPGAIRAALWVNRGRIGGYADAIAWGLANTTAPDVTQVQTVRRSRLGGYVNAEQELSGTLGFFMRASVADGRYAVFDFTDIDRSVSAGLTLAGKGWGRADDTISLGLVANGIDTVKRAYFAAGGLGLLIGDGMLAHYGTEAIAEASYSWHPIKPVAVTFDVQMVANPAYNRDRGPVGLLGLRLHAAF